MTVVVNTNISSISAARILSDNRNDLQRAMERLSSGMRINSAKDDAAGMAVASKMKADISSLNQAIRNTTDGISMVSTYDGAAAEIESMLVRMRELAVQAMSGTYESADLTNSNYEYAALKTELQRINTTTSFNRTVLGSTAGANSFTFFAGADVTKTGNTITFSAHTLDFNVSGASDTDVPTSITSSSALKTIDSANAASTAVVALDTAINKLNAKRAQAGALINRLEHTVANLMNVNQRLQEAVSGIQDTDYAAESASLARGMVLQQAGTAMLAQANQQPAYVLTLLRA